MIAIGIAIIALGLAIPSFRALLLNAEIRNAAESIQSGLQQARAEAIRRRNNVEFVLGAVAVNDQTSWQVKLPVADGGNLITKMASREGSVDVIRTVLPATATMVTFDLTGRPTVNAGGSPQLTDIHLDLPATLLSNASSQDLTVKILFTGKILMCDPNVLNANDPRFCTP
jgi:type IV fimbrial biogenesis protein FimT